jgi:hypothetical protein
MATIAAPKRAYALVAMYTQISIGDASRRYGVSIDTLRRWARTGRVRCWRSPSGKRLFDAEELERATAPVPEAQARAPVDATDAKAEGAEHGS